MQKLNGTDLHDEAREEEIIQKIFCQTKKGNFFFGLKRLSVWKNIKFEQLWWFIGFVTEFSNVASQQENLLALQYLYNIVLLRCITSSPHAFVNLGSRSSVLAFVQV